MSGDENDPVTRQTNLDWDRKVHARLDALNATIERGLADGSRLASKASTLKECLREHAEARIYDDWFALLDRIAACPGFGRFPTDKKLLATGLWGLKSEWYKRLEQAPLGCRGSQAILLDLEDEVRWFRELLEEKHSFPEKDPADCVNERIFKGRRDRDRFDFDHLTRKTADDLKRCLSGIESALFCLRNTNDDLML